MKVPMLGKGQELNSLDPGGRTEIKQDPVNNNCPHYSPSSPEQVSLLHQGESWFSCSYPIASLKVSCLLCFTAFLLLSWRPSLLLQLGSCFPPSLGSLLLTGLMGLLPHWGVLA